MHRKSVLVAVAACMAALASVQVAVAAETGGDNCTVETQAQRDARMRWWRDARFGMFIHWGLYAVPAGTWQGKQIPGLGEWIMFNANIPVSDYAKLAEPFNPVNFNANEWVRAAKNAGMKYVVITSKHHDGFAMFRSKASIYNIYDATPFKRDPLRELAAACKKYGIRLGFYYSQAQDWHHPGGGAWGEKWDPAQKGDFDAYVKSIAIPQVRELMTNYGKVSILWWDTPIDMKPESVQELTSLTKLQPGIVVNNRLGNGVPGDTETPENTIPPDGIPGRDWETCMTVNDTWGFKSDDTNWKSPETLIRNLIDIASKGGNLLLNVGPTAEGVFPEPIIERFNAMGKWLKVNGEAIYGTTANPFPKQPSWGRYTRRGSTLYLHVFDWPKDGMLRVPVTNDVTKAYLLAAPKRALSCAKSSDGIEIAVPKTAPDAIASVVVLEIKGDLVTI